MKQANFLTLEIHPKLDRKPDDHLDYTLGDLFLNAALKNGDSDFLVVSDERKKTYREAFSEIIIWIELFQNLGIQQGDRIFCYLEHPKDMLIFFLASQFYGTITACLSPVYSIDHAKTIAKQLGCRAVFSHFGADFHDIEIKLHPSDCKNQNKSKNLNENWKTLSTFNRANSSQDILMLQATSGSTGIPKWVVRSHRALIHYGIHAGFHIRANSNHRPNYLILLSFAHSFAYHQLTSALALEAKISVPKLIDLLAQPDDILRLGVTVAAFPPRVLNHLYKMAKETNRSDQLKNVFGLELESVIIGGGTGDEQILRSFKSQGIEPIQIYSSSETSLISITPRGHWNPRSSGILAQGVQIQFVGGGELLVKTPAIMKEYYLDFAESTLAFSGDGYYKTSDVAEIRGNQLYHLGRKSDVFSTFEGTPFFPARIEQLLEGIPTITQAILIGDARPFNIALLCIEAEFSSAELSIVSKQESKYDFIENKIKNLNTLLQIPEKIRHLVLFHGQFPHHCYSEAMGSKTKRNRKSICQYFRILIEEIYVQDHGEFKLGRSLKDCSHVLSRRREIHLEEKSHISRESIQL